MSIDAAVIGGGPAGLMAAETLASAGARVTVFDAKPSMGRKFLMAGKSGLNLTKDVDPDALIATYDTPQLAPVLGAFDARAVQDWARGLGQALFTGSSGRVFPHAMKASPLLRAWFVRLDGLGVVRQTRWRWQGFSTAGHRFETSEGAMEITARVTVLAMGGASWARLGSDGLWAAHLPHVPFQPSNVGLSVAWSGHMRRHFGAPLKAVIWRAGDAVSQGEAVLTAKGLEGGGLYPLSPALRAGQPLTVDLLPAQPHDALSAKLFARGKTSLANHLRKVRLDPAKIALLQEWGRPLPAEPEALAALIKALPVRHAGFRPMDEAISTAGGVPFAALDGDLMLRDRPGVYCAGEMLDWDAPTGGYLLTACLATGRWAGQAAARRLQGA